METPKSKNSIKRRRSSLQSRMADTPHGATHPTSVRKETKPLSRSIYFGILLFIQRMEPESLTPHQHRWIANYARKLEETQLLKAGRFSQQLMRQSKVQRFHLKDIQRVRRTIPWIEDKATPEPVRIGKGYTDKGALRPLHERGRLLSEIKFWDQDIPYLLPTFYDPVGRWITADEVRNLLGETVFQLTVMSLNMMVNPQQGILSQLQMLQNREE